MLLLILTSRRIVVSFDFLISTIFQMEVLLLLFSQIVLKRMQNIQIAFLVTLQLVSWNHSSSVKVLALDWWIKVIVNYLFCWKGSLFMWEGITAIYNSIESTISFKLSFSISKDMWNNFSSTFIFLNLSKSWASRCNGFYWNQRQWLVQILQNQWGFLIQPLNRLETTV